MKNLIYAFAFLAILSSCSNSKKVNVQDLNKQFIDAWNSKDSSKVNTLLADDVQFLQATSRLKGKSQVSEKWVHESMPFISNLKTSVISSNSGDNIAYEGGTFSVDVVSPNQPPAYGEGNYILLWKKQADGNWKLSYAQLEDLPLQIKNQQ